MKLSQIFEILKNEYNSGIFTLDADSNQISWVYNTEGVNNYDDAEERWLSFLGAKLTAEQVINNTNFKIVQEFELNNKIGFFIKLV